MMAAGSPGTTWRSPNTRMATTPMTGTVAIRRRPTSASIYRRRAWVTGPLRDRDVPEQGRREAQHARHRPAVSRRLHHLAERDVQDLVVRDPLDLRRVLLLPGPAEADRGADPAGRVRRGPVHPVRPGGAADGLPPGGDGRAALPGAPVLERLGRVAGR